MLDYLQLCLIKIYRMGCLKPRFVMTSCHSVTVHVEIRIFLVLGKLFRYASDFSCVSFDLFSEKCNAHNILSLHVTLLWNLSSATLGKSCTPFTHIERRPKSSADKLTRQFHSWWAVDPRRDTRGIYLAEFGTLGSRTL